MPHSLPAGWHTHLPRPKSFNQGNSTHCPLCSALLGFTFMGASYGPPDYAKEISKCPRYGKSKSPHIEKTEASA